jgi:hypothetical protein
MADTDVSVSFGAKTEDVDRGAAAVAAKINDIKNQTDAMASQFKTAGDTISDSMSKAAGSMKELESGFTSAFEAIKKGSLSEGTLLKLLFGGAIGGAAAEIVKSVRDMGEEFSEMEKHAKEATLTMEQYAALQKAVKDEVDAGKFAAGIEEAAKKWNDLNHGVSEQKKLLEENHVRLRDNTGQLIPFTDYLLIASRLIENSRTELDRFKIGEILGFSREWVRALQQGPEELKKATNEAAKTGTEHLKLIQKANEFSDRWKAATQDWGDKFKAVMIELFPYIEIFVNKVLEVLKVVAEIAAFFHQFGATPALAESITAAEHAANRARNSMQGVKEQFDEAVGSANRFRETFEAVGTRSSTIATQFRGVVDQMSPLPKVWQETYNKIVEVDGIVKKLGEEDFFSKKGTKIPVKDQFDSTALREFQAQLDQVKEKYQQLKVTEQTAVDTFKQTETEKVTHLRTALAERMRATEEIFAEELMKYGDNARMRATIERNFNREKAAIELEGLKQTEELLKKRTHEWESSLQGITSAFTSQLRGLLTGTVTWSQAIKNIMLDLVIKIIEEFLKLAIIKPLSGMLASAMAAPAELFTSLLKIIGNMFGPLFAGFTAFFAPVQGPAAPAEGAALAAGTVAAAAATLTLDTGTDYVPRTGLAMIHQGEAIIPASENVSPYTGGGSSPTFNINALDGPSVHNWLRSGGAAMIAKHVAKAMNGNPTLRPSY